MAATDNSAAVRDHYNKRRVTNVRDDGRLYHFRRVQNWLKQCLIHTYASKCRTVVDLGAGAGGDLLKWAQEGTGTYVAVDIAESALHVLQSRANATALRALVTHTVVADVGSAGGITLPVAAGSADAVSCQHMAHYMFESQCRAERFFTQMASCLRVGGTVVMTMTDAYQIVRHLRNARALVPGALCAGNDVFRVVVTDADMRKIDAYMDPAAGDARASAFGVGYQFYLGSSTSDSKEDAAAHVAGATEYLAPHELVCSLAANAGLHCVYTAPAWDFMRVCLEDEWCVQRALEKPYVFPRSGELDNDSMMGVGLYRVFVFRKT
jgi:SAM-dependent methyltransferase